MKGTKQLSRARLRYSSMDIRTNFSRAWRPVATRAAAGATVVGVPTYAIYPHDGLGVAGIATNLLAGALAGICASPRQVGHETLFSGPTKVTKVLDELLPHLEPHEQYQLRALFSGKPESVSGPASHVLRDVVKQKGWGSLSPEEKVSQLKAILKHPRVQPKSVSLKLQNPAGRHFHVEEETPGRFQVELAGRDPVTVIYDGPSKDEGRPHQHSVMEVAAALADLPGETRNTFTTVHIRATRSEDEAYWAEVFGAPELRTYMAVGSDKVIQIYPTRFKSSPRELRIAILHETGHIIFNDLLGMDKRSPRWGPWLEAVAKDIYSPSKYGDNSLAEDAAEATALYFSARGSPFFEEYRTLMPNRFAYLDELFSTGVM